MTMTRIVRRTARRQHRPGRRDIRESRQPRSRRKAGASHVTTGVTSGAVKNLQMGVGKSTIVDLPEEAAEIYVADPKIANAIVRSAKRIYVSAVANGQTSIFALAKDGRKIAIIDVSVGRDVGELTNLLNTAIPGNDIHVRTVADSIILTGSVASAGEAQKAIDIASGFVNEFDRVILLRRRRHFRLQQRQRKSDQLAHDPRSGPGELTGHDRRNSPRDRQTARRQHDRQRAEREFHARQPVRGQRRSGRVRGDIELGQGQSEPQRHPAGLRTAGRRPHPRRADRNSGLGGERKIHGRRHHSDRNQRVLHQAASARSGSCSSPTA